MNRPRPTHQVSPLTRRQVLRLAALGALGASSSGWIETLAADTAADPNRRKSCILLWMTGGPSRTVDIYDAATDRWSTSNLSQARGDIAALTVGGTAIFAGGWTGRSALATVDYRVDELIGVAAHRGLEFQGTLMGKTLVEYLAVARLRRRVDLQRNHRPDVAQIDRVHVRRKQLGVLERHLDVGQAAENNRRRPPEHRGGFAQRLVHRLRLSESRYRLIDIPFGFCHAVSVTPTSLFRQ